MTVGDQITPHFFAQQMGRSHAPYPCRPHHGHQPQNQRIPLLCVTNRSSSHTEKWESLIATRGAHQSVRKLCPARARRANVLSCASHASYPVGCILKALQPVPTHTLCLGPLPAIRECSRKTGPQVAPVAVLRRQKRRPKTNLPAAQRAACVICRCPLVCVPCRTPSPCRLAPYRFHGSHLSHTRTHPHKKTNARTHACTRARAHGHTHTHTHFVRETHTHTHLLLVQSQVCDVHNAVVLVGERKMHTARAKGVKRQVGNIL